MNLATEIRQGDPVVVTIQVGDYEWVYRGTLDDSRQDASIGVAAVDDPYRDMPEFWLSRVPMQPMLWDVDVRLRMKRTDDPVLRMTERGEAARRTREQLELLERHRQEREAK